MTKLPYMPIHVLPFLADTQRLSNEELGAYTRLLLQGWLEGGTLADEDLRVLACAPVERWPRLWKRLERYFTKVEPDGWTQKRLVETLDRTSKLQQVNAVRSAKARAGIARKYKRAPKPDNTVKAAVEKPVTVAVKDTVTATVTDHAPMTKNTVKETVTETKTKEEVLLPINRQSSTSSQNMADHAAVDNPQGQGGKDGKRADDEPVGGGGRRDQEALPKPLGAVVGQSGSGTLFGRLAAERRRRESEGEAPLPEQGEG
jgi:uncharacterized protein YdaU (DUF1376 family)